MKSHNDGELDVERVNIMLTINYYLSSHFTTSDTISLM